MVGTSGPSIGSPSILPKPTWSCYPQAAGTRGTLWGHGTMLTENFLIMWLPVISVETRSWRPLGCPRKLGSTVRINGLYPQYIPFIRIGEMTHWSDHHWSMILTSNRRSKQGKFTLPNLGLLQILMGWIQLIGKTPKKLPELSAFLYVALRHKSKFVVDIHWYTVGSPPRSLRVITTICFFGTGSDPYFWQRVLMSGPWHPIPARKFTTKFDPDLVNEL